MIINLRNFFKTFIDVDFEMIQRAIVAINRTIYFHSEQEERIPTVRDLMRICINQAISVTKLLDDELAKNENTVASCYACFETEYNKEDQSWNIVYKLEEAGRFKNEEYTCLCNDYMHFKPEEIAEIVRRRKFNHTIFNELYNGENSNGL